jgi:hypothetical protein
MTPEERVVIADLKSRGFAVIVWTPEELAGASRRHVEDRSIELGWQVIEDLKEMGPDSDDDDDDDDD